MKVFNQKDYEYLGIADSWHAFMSIKAHFDPEIVLVYRARYILKDGNSIFLDPVDPKSGLRFKTSKCSIEVSNKDLKDIEITRRALVHRSCVNSF